MSKSKDRALEFLIIDDDKPYVENFYRTAQKLRIRFKHFTSLEEARELIESKGAQKVSGVILDVKCMIYRKQTSAQSNFIMEAIIYFQKNLSHIPIAILTGEPDKYKSLKEDFEGRVNVYFKGKDEEKLLSDLSFQAHDLDHVRLTNQYYEVFEVFDNDFLDSSDRETLLECIKNMNSNEEARIKNTLSGIRRLQESIYRAINKVDGKMVPDEFLLNGRTDFRGIQWHLRGRFNKNTRRNEGEEYVPMGSNIDEFADSLYTVVSNYGSHKKFSEVTKYTLSTLTFAIMDLLLWFKGIIQRKE